MASLSELLGGAVDPMALQQHLQNGGSIHITINNHKGAGDDENAAEGLAEKGKEEPGEPSVEHPAMDDQNDEPGMMGAVKRALRPPPKAPSPGVGKGPAHPVTAPKSAKLPQKGKKPEPKAPAVGPAKKGK